MNPEAQMVAIVRGLAAEDPARRARAADEVSDLVGEYSAHDAAALAYLLAALRISESDELAQESQLHALAELADWHDLPPRVFGLLAHVPQESVRGSQVEYMKDLSD